MAEPKLTKVLYTDITRLKLLNRDTAEVKFQLIESPFTGDEDDEEMGEKKREEYVIIGRIFPNSEIYRERSYTIEIKLTKAYPGDPPEVRFLTPIYHPNVDEDGRFCNELLVKTAKWKFNTSLVQVIKVVVEHIDHPDIDHSMRANVGSEYMNQRAEFNRKALECVMKHGLSRT